MPNRAPSRPRVVAGLRLVRLVGRGGEGEVWEARSPRGEARALKLVRPDALVEPSEVERRGRWLRTVDHPALVQVRRTGVLTGGGLDGWAFVEMPFLDGPSMDAAEADPGIFARLEGLAEALDLLHAGAWSDGVPLVHRDVKPANLIDVDGALVLVDHSTLRDAASGTITRIGTPVFAAPEVALGRAGPPADLYAFAATAVALKTGARGPALARLLDDPWQLDLPDGLRGALAPDLRDRPTSCRSALDPSTTVLRPSQTAGVPPSPGDAAAGEHAWHDTGWPEPGDGWAAGGDTGPVWRWLGALAVVALAPPAAYALGWPVWPDLAAVTAGAALLHLVAQATAGGPPALRVVAPPLAWAWLLADRSSPAPRRRDYARAALTGTLGSAAAAVVWALAQPATDRALPLLLTAGGLLLAGACVRAARAGGPLLQFALLPLWAAGAAALLVAAVGLLPVAALAGRGRAAAGLAAGTLASAAETLRRPREGTGDLDL